jgi:aspartate/methionine/tyrosine aminotransferase
MGDYLTRMQSVQSPIIPLVGQLIREHSGTISLGQGVVFYPPPLEAISAGISDFFKNPQNHQYKAVEGIPELLDILIQKLAQNNQIKLHSKQRIMVTAGGNMGFINALLAITNQGDEIILNTPYYFNHEMAINMANCYAILVETDENYQLQPQAIAAAITSKTRAVVTISPNNPTGVVYPESTLREVNNICKDKGIYHIHDEAYDYFIYDGIKHFSPASIPDSHPHTIALYSLSKAYGFASWRVGYMVIPEHLWHDIHKIQDTILICPPVISQYAALGALKVGKAYCQPYLKTLSQVREIVLDKLQEIRDICTFAPAQGAFYCFLRVNTELGDFDLVKKLIEDYKIAVLPGSTFGMKEGCYLRLAYGNLQPEAVNEGMARLITGLRNSLS